MPYYAKVILDSIGPWGNRLTTMEFTIPKLWLAEFNTHCMFARNSASTRAIPFQKQKERVINDPFIPFEWPLEQRGMSASEMENELYVIRLLRKAWLEARNYCIEEAEYLTGRKIHKQLAGRLIELWQYQTVLVTGDEASYANFFHQRCSKFAAPEIRKSAELMWEAYSQSVPTKITANEWHLPLITNDDWLLSVDHKLMGSNTIDLLKQVSAARCARLSYLTHHGIRDIQEDLNLFSRLTTQGHWSPLEHVCQCLSKPSWILRTVSGVTGLGFRKSSKWEGWRSLRSLYPNEYVKEYKG